MPIREGWQNGECTGLENRRPHGLAGSNPAPSALIYNALRRSPLSSFRPVSEGVWCGMWCGGRHTEPLRGPLEVALHVLQPRVEVAQHPLEEIAAERG